MLVSVKSIFLKIEDLLCVLKMFSLWTFFLKDTHRGKAPSNKTPALWKSTNMGVWVVGTLNQLFIRGSQTETKLSKI